MHLLYLDDSGSVQNPEDSHIVLAGFSVFERQGHYIANRLDGLSEELWPDNPSGLEFRGADIFNGKKQWRGLRRDVRISALKRALGFISLTTSAKLFGVAVHKAAVSPEEPMEYAFEQVCNRFDRYLGRLHNSGDTQRGLIILDESVYETSLQGLARNFRVDGHRWGRLYNLAEVPLFVDSKATRLIQCADLIAYSIRRYIEKGDSSFFDVVSHKFHSEGGVLHGLVHYTPPASFCSCMACRQRRSLNTS